MQNSQYIFAKWLQFALIPILITACSVTPQRELPSTEQELAITLENITELLNQANAKDSAERTRIYMDITQVLLEGDEVDWARNTLTQVPLHSIPEDQAIRYTVLSAALAVAQGEPYLAKRYLWSPRIEELAQTSPTSDRIKFHEMRARLLFSLAEYRESITERTILSSLIAQGSEEDENNQNRLWQTLMELSFIDLKLESQIQDTMLSKGWYTLAALSKDNQTNLRQQLTEVDRWILSWPEHPASLRLPVDLQLLQELAEDQPMQLAILLPFSGRFEAAANAIRDGIMAAYYDAMSYDNRVPDLRIYDTSSRDINHVYDEAALEGAQLIIGPLEQSKIAELALRLELPIPILALNRLSSPLNTPNGLFQFGLPLEDEAEQVAEQAWRDGHRRAMVLAPATNSGDRSVSSFSNRWLALGGEIINNYRYKNQADYSDLIKSAVKIQDSEKRHKQVRTIIGRAVEFEPRRRKDIDFIFLYSQASQARQLKPILAFHYAGDVPVYAIKDIYNGNVNAKLDKDLNEIRFTTLPWFFDNSLPEKQAIAANSQTTNYQFLYALGVDAYHIYPRLRQLKEVKQAQFYGTTGKLKLDEHQKIKREQIWAKFVNGRATQVATFSSQDGFQ